MKTITGRPAAGATLLDPVNGFRALPADSDSTVPSNAHWKRAVKRGDFIVAPQLQPKPAQPKSPPKAEQETD